MSARIQHDEDRLSVVFRPRRGASVRMSCVGSFSSGSRAWGFRNLDYAPGEVDGGDSHSCPELQRPEEHLLPIPSISIAFYLTRAPSLTTLKPVAPDSGRE